MYAPHTVTVYNVGDDDTPNITILRGVFLDIAQGTNIMKSGLANADAATLYIPMPIRAVNALTGEDQQYLPPAEYELQETHSGYWTIGKRSTQGQNSCFFVKGEAVHPDSDYGSINSRYDYCYRVSTVDPRDFGSQNMHHLQVGGT